MKKVLVTGGAGFVGTNLIKRLIDEGYTVYSLDDYSSGYVHNHVKGVHYIKADIEQISQVVPQDFDIIFHLAARARIQPSFTNPSETFRVNVVGTECVLEFARKTSAKIVYAGSSSRHRGTTGSPYAMYKHMGEELCMLYRDVFDLDVEICRFYNVYGPHEIIEGEMAAVIGIWRNQINKKQPITIVGDGEQKRDFTHIDDIVDGLYDIIATDKKHPDAWELGTGTSYSIKEVAEMFRVRFGCELTYIDEQKGNYRKSVRVNDDAIKRLGWNPKSKLQEYINSL